MISWVIFFEKWKTFGVNGGWPLPDTIVEHVSDYVSDSSNSVFDAAYEIFKDIRKQASVAGFLVWVYLNLPNLTDDWDNVMIMTTYKLKMQGCLTKVETRDVVNIINTVNVKFWNDVK